MSMPRDDSSFSASNRVHRGRTPSSASVIGRIGGLAVALGIGAAISGSPGIAAADTDGPDSSSESSASHEPSSTEDTAAGASAKITGGTAPTPRSTTGQPDATPSSSSRSDPDADAESEVGVADEAVSTAPDRDSPTTTTPLVEVESPAVVRSDPTPTKSSRRPTEPSTVRVNRVAAEIDSAGAEPSSPQFSRQARVESAVPSEAEAHDEQRPVATVTAIDGAVTPEIPVVNPASFVTGLVSGLLSVIGLNPLATSGSPVEPAQAPTTWALLGWVRRELGHLASPSTASTASAMTTSLVQPTAAIAATSPLGTQQQLDAERRAAETANTLPVALMKLVLRFGFRSAAQQQFAQVGGPNQGNVDQLDAAVNEYAMGAAFQQQILNSNDPMVVMQVAPPHTWFGQSVPGSRILYDNPDTIYRFIGVNAASTYVIRGQFTGDRPADATFSVLTGLSGNTAAVLGGRDLVVNPDGSFEITASRDPAAPGQPNHLQLTNESTLIATRNTLSDWGSEVPMTLSIERVGGPPNSLFSQLGGFAIPSLGPLVVGNPLLTALVSVIPPLADPPPVLRGAFAAVIMALGIQREATYMAVATTDPETGQPIPPNVLKNPTRNAEFLATQLQSAGYFQLTDQQALVVTIDPGNARYFVLPVTNDWTISKDYWNQQTSLNDSQAIANPDGTYTIVVSPTDPGVANWVSTGGLNQGTISMRFQDLDAGSPDLPTVSSQVVTLDALGTVLPPTTVYYTEAQRAAQLATRKAGFDNRFAPYPQP